MWDRGWICLESVFRCCAVSGMLGFDSLWCLLSFGRSFKSRFRLVWRFAFVVCGGRGAKVTTGSARVDPRPDVLVALQLLFSGSGRSGRFRCCRFNFDPVKLVVRGNVVSRRRFIRRFSKWASTWHGVVGQVSIYVVRSGVCEVWRSCFDFD